jgi:8-oxo-dGTP diphosphatase
MIAPTFQVTDSKSRAARGNAVAKNTGTQAIRSNREKNSTNRQANVASAELMSHEPKSRDFNSWKPAVPGGSECPPSGRRGAVAVIRRGPQLLVIQRSQHVVAPGAYCFPGGTIETGETPAEAVRRELWEELAVNVVPQHCLWESTTPWNVHLAWWLAELNHQQAPTPNPAEVAACHWLTPAEIRLLPGLLESNHQFLAAWQRGEFTL